MIPLNPAVSLLCASDIPLSTPLVSRPKAITSLSTTFIRYFLIHAVDVRYFVHIQCIFITVYRLQFVQCCKLLRYDYCKQRCYVRELLPISIFAFESVAWEFPSSPKKSKLISNAAFFSANNVIKLSTYPFTVSGVHCSSMFPTIR